MGRLPCSQARLAFSFLILSWCVCLAAPATAQDVVGDVFASDASVRGSVVLAGGGTRVISGSTVSAGLSAATMKLARGGDLRVCPGTNVSISTSQSGQRLSLGFNTGAVELHYNLASTADTIQTSDFRLLLAGPGTFHLAVSADQLGNTCVRPLAQNTSSVIVQELFGDASYQVKADEPIVFRKGHVADASKDVPPDCGCPVLPEVKRAEADSSQRRRGDAEKQDQKATTPGALTQRRGDAEEANQKANPGDVAAAASEASLTAKPQGSTPAEVESPFVFHADPNVPDPPVLTTVRLSDRGKVLAFQPVVLPPGGTKVAAQAGNPQNRTFLGRLRSFFAGIFK